MSNEQLPQQHDENQEIIKKEGELCSQTSTLPVSKKPKRKWHIFLWMIGMVVVLIVAKRLIPPVPPPPPCPPNCGGRPEIPPPPPPKEKTIEIAVVIENGETRRFIVNEERYSSFIKQQFNFFEEKRKELQSNIQKKLNEEMDNLFQKMKQDIPRFADWYFAYPTTYSLLLKTVSSYFHHVEFFSFFNEKKDVSRLVAEDLQKYLQKHYEDIVLKPEINDFQLKDIYKTQLKIAYEEWLNILMEVQDKFQVFILKETSHSREISDQGKIKFDWQVHFNKINFALSNKSNVEIEVLRGLLFGTGGAIIGKAGATTLLLSKLASPFVAKIVTIGGMGALGSLGGPVGSVVGFTGGIFVDYLLNEGIALVKRDEFIHDTEKALQSTKDSWEKPMQITLNEIIQIWFDDSIQLLRKYEATQK